MRKRIPRPLPDRLHPDVGQSGLRPPELTMEMLLVLVLSSSLSQVSRPGHGSPSCVN